MESTVLTQKVPTRVAFVLSNGVKVQSLDELITQIEQMDIAEFGHFVHSSHNHFANWIEDIFELEDLPNALRSVHTKKDTLAVLKSALSYNLIHSIEKNKTKTAKDIPPPPNAVKEKYKNPLAQKIDPISEHIEHLHKKVAHITKYDTHTPKHTHKSYEPISEEVRDKLVDFGFGLIIGLIVGLLIAKGLGAF